MKRWLLGLLLTATALAAPLKVWKEQGASVILRNAEVTPDNQYVLVHLQVTPEMDLAAFRWQQLVQLRNAAGEYLPQAADCGVNMKMTTGNFPMQKGRGAALMLYYFTRKDDYPVQIEVEGVDVGKPLPPRR